MYLNKSFAVLVIATTAIIFTGCGARGAYFDKFEQPAKEYAPSSITLFGMVISAKLPQP